MGTQVTKRPAPSPEKKYAVLYFPSRALAPYRYLSARSTHG